MKINVGILFGGRSAEHEVSLQSAKNIFDAIDKEKYNPILIGIDKTGKWMINNESEFLLNSENPKLIKLNQSSDSVALIPQSGGQLLNLSGMGENLSLDVIFPILHGPYGEDGTVQGLLKLVDLPFVGTSVLASAVSMDKEIMKRVLRDAGMPIGNFIAVRSHETVPDFEVVKQSLGLPIFVKPANMGSSVGVSKVENETDYGKAVSLAFSFDNKILLEECIYGREIECAVLGNENPIASIPGEIIPNHDFYSYDAKYIDENGAGLSIPADIPQETIKRVQELSINTFKVLCCEGLGRVDFFLKDNGEIIINEINTMPGFTKVSMYPKLWEASGISYSELISTLIDLAFRRFEKERILNMSYLI